MLISENIIANQNDLKIRNLATVIRILATVIRIYIFRCNKNLLYNLEFYNLRKNFLSFK